MNDDFISKGLSNLLKNGINLSLDSPEEEDHYMMKLHEYFDAKTEFNAYLKDGKSLEIENSELTLIMELIISESTLYFIPYNEEIFEILVEVLNFIARYHKSIILDFRGLEEFRIDDLSNLREMNYEKTEEAETPEEESSSDDDYEWI